MRNYTNKERENLLKYYCRIIDESFLSDNLLTHLKVNNHNVVSGCNLKDRCIGNRTLDLCFVGRDNEFYAPTIQYSHKALYELSDRINLSPEEYIKLLQDPENYYINKLPQAEITEAPIEKDSLEDLILRIKKLGDEILGMDIHVLIQPRIKE